MSRPSVKERRDEMIAKLKMAGKNGIETKKFINDFTNKWGYKRTTVKKDTLELVELEKAKIDKTRIYHSMYSTPSEMWNRIHPRHLSRKS
ncbi:unnamed protein product [marine sediment metagenome]|uniref:Uncharacterized protein n=1 Tax=marine sediment metagenome TaxID=412755 RepID=X0VRE1_9ZZZZ